MKYDDADNKKPGLGSSLSTEFEKVFPCVWLWVGRDLENNTIEVMRRDTLEKETITCDDIEEYVKNLFGGKSKRISSRKRTITVRLTS